MVRIKAPGLAAHGSPREPTGHQISLPPVKEYTAVQIKRIRMVNKASQAVFAMYLNTSPSTVQKWEQGKKKPDGKTVHNAFFDRGYKP
jgi:putative transcriptional regulator